MLSGAGRVLAGVAATVGMWAIFAVILPGGVMVVTLYIVRFMPLVGRSNRAYTYVRAMSGKKIAIPDEIYERVQQVATAEGTTVEQLATKALERDLARRWLERIGREGELRRG